MNMDQPFYVSAAEDLRENEDQWNAYQSPGSIVILAGPGSGKTKTLTIKIARLLAEDVKRPQRLACITYSNACVGELQTRLQKVGVVDGERLTLCTVHSFCLTELVAPYASMAGIIIPEPLKVASPAQAKQLFEDAYRAELGGSAPNWFRTVCDKLRRTILDRGSREWHDWSARETRVVEAYEALLAKSELMDFDSLVLNGLELIENHEWVRRAIRAKYPVIVIDEYQDLGLPLHRIVLSLLKAGVRIIAVGDPDQSIYGFTGANPLLLKSLGRSSKVKCIKLKLNYRCADQIIAASRTLLPIKEDFRSHDGRMGEIHIHQRKCNIQDQAKYALEELVPTLLKANPSWMPGDIALLYRSLNEGNTIAQVADQLGMRYFRLDNGAPIKRTRLINWLTEAAEWCAGGWQTDRVQLSSLLKGWRRMERSVTPEADQLASRRRLVSALFSLRDGSQSLQAWLQALRIAVLDDMVHNEPGLADEFDNLEHLAAASARGGKLQDFTVEIFGNHGKSPDLANLMTLHSSKGLEFQVVIMVGLERGVFPSDLDTKRAEQLEEARRLFYVGVTRAKTQIHLMFDANESPFITAIRTANCR